MNLKVRALSFLKDELVVDTAIVFFGTSLGGFFSLLYHMVSVRLLTFEEYGTFNALISFVIFGTMAVSPMGTTLTRFFTEYIARKDFAALNFIFIRLIKRLFIAGILSFLLFSVFSPSLARFLKTQPHHVIICGGIIALSLFSLPVSPFFQSLQKFVVYSLIGVLSSFGKLIFGALLMFIGWGILGGLSGFLAATLLILLVGLIFIPHTLRNEIGHLPNNPTPVTASLVPMYKYFFPVSVTLFSFALLTNVDVILVKHFFPPLDAGYYSIAQMVGKIALFLPSALAIVILPKSTAAHVNNSFPVKLLYKSLFLAGGCCFLFTGLSFLFPELLLRILTGKVNPVSTSLAGLFSLAMSFYALCWVAINFLLAIHDLKILLPLLLLGILETGFIVSCHPSLKMVIYILVVFSLASFLVAIFVVKRAQKGKLFNESRLNYRFSRPHRFRSSEI